MTLELNAKVRKTLGKKVKSLRKKGIIPAVLYGAKTKSIPLAIDYDEFKKIYKEAGESTIIKLKIDKEVKNVLIYDIIKDPVTDKFSHIDFYVVRMDKPITTEVPLVFEGESPAVETQDGVLVKNINEVEVEALPANLPHEIKVDISALKTFDDLIHIKDLKVPEGVKILANPDEVVALVSPPRTEEELAALEEEIAAPGESRLEREEKPEEVEKVGEKERAVEVEAEKEEKPEEEKEKKEK